MTQRRYPPWLQKALHVKDQTEHFWSEDRQQQQKPSSTNHASQIPAVPAPISSQLGKPTPTSTSYASVWAAVDARDASAVRDFAERDALCALARREAAWTEDVGCGGDGVTLLHTAATRGDPAIVAVLLNALQTSGGHEAVQSAVNSVDTHCSRTTPLFATCRSSEVSQCVDRIMSVVRQ